MSTNTDIVTRFLDAWGANGGYKAAVQEFFTPDCVYENVGVSNTTGPGEALAFLDGFAQQLGFASMKYEMHGIAGTGNVVMTERTDHLFDSAGRRFATLRLMGVFEIKGGRISVWRDYFDSKALAPS